MGQSKQPLLSSCSFPKKQTLKVPCTFNRREVPAPNSTVCPLSCFKKAFERPPLTLRLPDVG